MLAIMSATEIAYVEDSTKIHSRSLNPAQVCPKMTTLRTAVAKT